MFAVTQLSYLVASALFIFALHWMNTPATARRGVYAGVAATAIAVLITWAQPTVIHHVWIENGYTNIRQSKSPPLNRSFDQGRRTNGAFLSGEKIEKPRGVLFALDDSDQDRTVGRNHAD